MAKLIGALVIALALTAVPARAHDAYDDSQAHPLQLITYAVHPIGFALEWLVTRPIHFLVSQPKLEPVFGHEPHTYPFGEYEPYEPEAPDASPVP
jgi:hypothetical protein